MNIYVIDTVGFIRYYYAHFKQDNIISNTTRIIIDNCLDRNIPQYKLIIPSIVFVELFDNFLHTENDVLNFKYNIYDNLKNCEDVEIKGIEKEVLKIYSEIDDGNFSLENHDKIILSSAIQMNCKLITNDSKIINYVYSKQNMPGIIF